MKLGLSVKIPVLVVVPLCLALMWLVYIFTATSQRCDYDHMDKSEAAGLYKLIEAKSKQVDELMKRSNTLQTELAQVQKLQSERRPEDKCEALKVHLLKSASSRCGIFPGPSKPVTPVAFTGWGRGCCRNRSRGTLIVCWGGECVNWASRTRKRSEACFGRPGCGGEWAAKTVKRLPQQPVQPQRANC